MALQTGLAGKALLSLRTVGGLCLALASHPGQHALSQRAPVLTAPWFRQPCPQPRRPHPPSPTPLSPRLHLIGNRCCAKVPGGGMSTAPGCQRRCRKTLAVLSTERSIAASPLFKSARQGGGSARGHEGKGRACYSCDPAQGGQPAHGVQGTSRVELPPTRKNRITMYREAAAKTCQSSWRAGCPRCA